VSTTLEPGGLQPDPQPEQGADQRARRETGAAERPHPRPAGERQRAGRDRVPHRQEREQRVDVDRVLHLHECHAPHGGDGYERDESHG
jgi:hypothetical protein